MAPIQSLTTSASLLEAVRGRDSEAWRRLTAIYGPTVFQWCKQAGLQAADAADITQAVFATVAANVERFRDHRPGDTFRGWLWTIFHSRLIDFYRENRRRPRVVGDSEVKRLKDDEPVEPPPTTSQYDDDAACLVRRALKVIQGDFSESTWQAFWRTTVDSQATGDVARELEMTPAAVCMCRSRVIRRLRETLEGLGVLGGEMHAEGREEMERPS